MTKFADAPQTIDSAADADIRISSSLWRIGAAKELLSRRCVPVSDGSFGTRVPAGELKIFEIR